MEYKTAKGKVLKSGDLLIDAADFTWGVFYQDSNEARIDYIFRKGVDIYGESIILSKINPILPEGVKFIMGLSDSREVELILATLK